MLSVGNQNKSNWWIISLSFGGELSIYCFKIFTIEFEWDFVL